MIWQHVRIAVLAGGILVASGMTVRAEDAPPPAASAAPAAAAPQYRTVCVNEWVPETYEKVCTVYKKVCAEEKYTAYRCETVPETRTRTVQVCENVSTVEEVVRKVCVSVPHVEQRCVMETHWVCKPECRTVRKCVDKGHYECREVPCGPSFGERAHKLLHRGCCEDECCAPCPRTKSVKVWVPCPVWEEKTVTCMKRVCESRPVSHSVTVCRTEVKEVREKVTVCKPVLKNKTETYTCNVVKRIPYEATRTVERCVPEQKTVTGTRMVCRQVQKQVPVVTCCEEAASCCKPGFLHRFGGHGGHHHGCCD